MILCNKPHETLRNQQSSCKKTPLATELQMTFCRNLGGDCSYCKVYIRIVSVLKKKLYLTFAVKVFRHSLLNSMWQKHKKKDCQKPLQLFNGNRRHQLTWFQKTPLEVQMIHSGKLEWNRRYPPSLYQKTLLQLMTILGGNVVWSEKINCALIIKRQWSSWWYSVEVLLKTWFKLYKIRHSLARKRLWGSWWSSVETPVEPTRENCNPENKKLRLLRFPTLKKV